MPVEVHVGDGRRAVHRFGMTGGVHLTQEGKGVCAVLRVGVVDIDFVDGISADHFGDLVAVDVACGHDRRPGDDRTRYPARDGEDMSAEAEAVAVAVVGQVAAVDKQFTRAGIKNLVEHEYLGRAVAVEIHDDGLPHRAVCAVGIFFFPGKFIQLRRGVIDVFHQLPGIGAVVGGCAVAVVRGTEKDGGTVVAVHACDCVGVVDAVDGRRLDFLLHAQGVTVAHLEDMDRIDALRTEMPLGKDNDLGLAVVVDVAHKGDTRVVDQRIRRFRSHHFAEAPGDVRRFFGKTFGLGDVVGRFGEAEDDGVAASEVPQRDAAYKRVIDAGVCAGAAGRGCGCGEGRPCEAVVGGRCPGVGRDAVVVDGRDA